MPKSKVYSLYVSYTSIGCHFNKYNYTTTVQSHAIVNTKNGSIIQSNPYQLVMNQSCTPCKVSTFNSSVIPHIYYSTYCSILSYAMNALCTCTVFYPQSYTKFHKWHYTLVARPFTCGIVCLPFFLKVIEKGGIIRALQVAVGTTFKHESILLLYQYTIKILYTYIYI